MADPVRVVTWNVNSINARADRVALHLDERRPDLLLMQELKCEDSAVPAELFEDRDYWLETHGQKTYPGVGMAARHDALDDVERGLHGGDDGEARLIAASWRGIRVVNVYCPQGQDVASPRFAHKQRFYRALIDWIAARHAPSDPLILAGDLNVAPDPSDVWDPVEMKDQVGFHPIEHRLFAELLGWGLFDAARRFLPPGTHTFWDFRGAGLERGRGMRIDHFLVTAPVLERVVGASVDVEERRKAKASDHAPVVLELRP